MLITFCVLRHNVIKLTMWLLEAFSGCQCPVLVVGTVASNNRDCRPVAITKATIMKPYFNVKLRQLIQHPPKSDWNAMFLFSNEGNVFVSCLAFLTIVSKVLYMLQNVIPCLLFIARNFKQNIVMLASANHINEFEDFNALLPALNSVARVLLSLPSCDFYIRYTFMYSYITEKSNHILNVFMYTDMYTYIIYHLYTHYM